MDWELGNAMLAWLAAADLPVRARVRRVVTRRLPYAYPLYTRGYEEFFEIVDRWLSGLDGLLTFGHARWAGFRSTFASHVVEG